MFFLATVVFGIYVTQHLLFREHLLLAKERLGLSETETAECTAKLSLLEQKFLQMEKELESKTRYTI